MNWSRMVAARALGCGRHLAGHVDVEELEPPADGLGVGGVDVAAVDHVGEERGGLRDGVDQRRPLGAGLLVLEGAGHEDRHLDVAGPVDHRPAVEERGVPSLAGARAPPSAGRPGSRGSPTGCGGPGRPGRSTTSPRWRPARRRSRSRSTAGRRRAPGWGSSGVSRPSTGRSGGLGVVDPRRDPAGGEAVVVDAAGIAGREQVVGGAHRGDGGQARRIGAGRRELREARVADADHAHLVVGHPRLMGGDLDGVVGVVVGRVAEEVEGPTGAARSPHLQADGGEAGHPGQHRPDVGGAVGQQVRVAAVGARRAERLGEQRGDRVGGSGHVVTRVLDDGGTGARGAARPAVGEAHGGGQPDAVPHGEVVEALVQGLPGVESGLRWPDCGPGPAPEKVGVLCPVVSSTQR